MVSAVDAQVAFVNPSQAIPIISEAVAVVGGLRHSIYKLDNETWDATHIYIHTYIHTQTKRTKYTKQSSQNREHPPNHNMCTTENKITTILYVYSDVLYTLALSTNVMIFLKIIYDAVLLSVLYDKRLNSLVNLLFIFLNSLTWNYS